MAYCRAGSPVTLAAQGRRYWGQSVNIFVRIALAAALMVAAGITPVTSQAAQVTSRPIEDCKPLIRANNNFVEIGFLPQPNRLPTTGSVKITAVFVDFTDEPAQIEAQQYFSQFVRQGLTHIEDFSYGQVRFDIDGPHGWIRMPRPSSEYSFFRGMSNEDFRAFAESALRQADSSVDFSQTDGFIVVVPPSIRRGFDVSPAFVETPETGVRVDGNLLMNGTVIGTDAPWARPLVLAHEILHTMGLVDLYSFASTPPDFATQHEFVGPYGTMGDITGRAPGLFAWERWVLKWIRDDQIACLGEGVHTVELNSVNRDSSGSRMSVLPLGGSRFLALEARTSTGLDSRGFNGVLPYVVDPSIPTGYGPIRVPRDSGGSVMEPLGVGMTLAVEGVGIEVVSRTGDSFTVRVHSPVPSPTVPSAVVGAKATRLFGSNVTVSWREPLHTGWTLITGYEYRVGKGPWAASDGSRVSLRAPKRGQSLVVEVRAVNSQGVGPSTRVTYRSR